MLEQIFIFSFGLIIGSFLNSVIYRLEVGGSLVSERSRCPHCGHILSWYELIPLVSFLMQKGKCRACVGRISWQYPLVELAMAVLFVVAYQSVPGYALVSEAAYLFFVLAALVVILVVDFKWYIIPDRVLYPLIAVVLSHAWWGSPLTVPSHPFWSAFWAWWFFFMLYSLSKGTWIGFGDVKFGLFMGLFLGFPIILVGLFLSYILGAFIGGVLLVLKNKTFKSQIPFGPFLVAGTLIAYFWGTDIIEWYLNSM